MQTIKRLSAVQKNRKCVDPMLDNFRKKIGQRYNIVRVYKNIRLHTSVHVVFRLTYE